MNLLFAAMGGIEFIHRGGLDGMQDEINSLQTTKVLLLFALFAVAMVLSVLWLVDHRRAKLKAESQKRELELCYAELNALKKP